ncbi:D-2-hydroxyacid dehydrogenase [Chitinivibrio alkaliphilus]|uniref:D-isomer specific 2-hydroxyacid dehydrogenase n=1 Tax=Chitinivibrio alkaliphilus ACht1 TaxID=1313304 RepID=U7D9V5_9BACT|nr:D-2-hydroxyacid dehydrogenase [Chitinivibrio alkaliphilus]ERP39189.1 D-isomer specific 2-hydroxyacid dehydrogenase [Chitinivibrio alkaliphilus ACht1]
MKITVLDGHALNPGDLSWDQLRTFGEVDIYENTTQDMVIARLKESDIAIINKVILSPEILQKLPHLSLVAVTATGVNNVALETAKQLGITVCNVPAYSTDSVAQMVFAHILASTNRVREHSDSVKQGEWERAEQFSYWKYPLMELAGKQMGIIGFGNIGKAVATIAKAFGMHICCHTRTVPEEDVPNVTFMDKESLFAHSDIVVLTCPLTEETHHIINSETLKQMKKTALLINTGRGDLIDETALAQALTHGEIAHAGVDVLHEEPPVSGSPLISAPNTMITPHIAWASFEARTRAMEITCKNIEQFCAGTPQNSVV